MGEKQLCWGDSVAEVLIVLTVSCACEIRDKINTKSLRWALKGRDRYVAGIFETVFTAGWYSSLCVHPRFSCAAPFLSGPELNDSSQGQKPDRPWAILSYARRLPSSKYSILSLGVRWAEIFWGRQLLVWNNIHQFLGSSWSVPVPPSNHRLGE